MFFAKTGNVENIDLEDFHRFLDHFFASYTEPTSIITIEAHGELIHYFKIEAPDGIFFVASIQNTLLEKYSIEIYPADFEFWNKIEENRYPIASLRLVSLHCDKLKMKRDLVFSSGNGGLRISSLPNIAKTLLLEALDFTTP